MLFTSFLFVLLPLLRQPVECWIEMVKVGLLDLRGKFSVFVIECDVSCRFFKMHVCLDFLLLHHKFSNLKQHKFIISQFCKSQVWEQFNWILSSGSHKAEIKVLSGAGFLPGALGPLLISFIG